MSNFVFHVGMTKSGTTTLQQSLFQNHSEIFYLGKYKPHKSPRGTFNNEVFSILEPALWQNLDEPINDLEQSREVYQSLTKQYFQDKKIILDSWENFADLTPRIFTKRIRRLCSIVGPIRILFTLRNPYSWLPAKYLEALKNNYYKDNRKHWFKGRPYLNFDTWLQNRARRWKGLAGFLNHTDNIRTSVDLLGRENTGIFPLEQLAASSDEYYRSLSAFLRIGARETLLHTQKSHMNCRLLESDLEYIRYIDSSPERYERWKHISEAQRRHDLQAAREASTVPARPVQIQLSPKIASIVLEATSADHEWLSQLFDLPLETYGYKIGSPAKSAGHWWNRWISKYII